MPAERKPRIVAYDGELFKGKTPHPDISFADSLYSAVNGKDKKKLKSLEKAVNEGKIIRIM